MASDALKDLIDIQEILEKASERRLALANDLVEHACDADNGLSYDLYDLADQLDEAATELRATDRQIRDMAEALVKAQDYFGAPTEGDFDGMPDDAAVRLTMMVRIGDIKQIRAALPGKEK